MKFQKPFLRTPTAPPEVIVEGGCPDEWFPYKNRCFRFFSEKNSWGSADNFCQVHLIVINRKFVFVKYFEENGS